MALNTFEAYGLTVLKKQHPLIKSLRKTLCEPDIHGDQVWSSSFLIMDYLLHHRLRRKTRVMEVGCGWGLLSVFCAREFEASVEAVDADEKVFPYLHAHAVLNEVAVNTSRDRYELIKTEKLSNQGVLLGADICFWDELVGPLYRLIKKALAGGVKTIIIADPGRQPFMDLAAKCEKRMNAELIEWDVDEPRQGSGYLLVVKQC